MKAYLFDLDGVIVDSETEYTRIWEQIGLAFPTGVEDFARKIKGTTIDNILSTYYPEPERASGVRQMLYDLEENMDFPVFDGARRLLDELKDREVPCALVTSSNEVKMRVLWSRNPWLRDYFHVVVTADMVSRSKPDPEGYLKGASLLGFRPGECTVVEDSLQGVKAGRSAGCRVIGVAGTLPADVLAPYSDILTDVSYSNIQF